MAERRTRRERKVAAAVEEVTDIRDARTFEVPEIKDSWLEAPAIGEVAQGLIERWPRRFGHIGSEDVGYYWKRKGGRTGRKDRLSGAMIPSGSSLLMHVLRKGIVIYLCADHVKSRNLSERQIEALVFSQMMRIGKNAKGGPVLQAPDFAGFRAELQEYGHWSEELQKIANIQLGLGLSDDEEGDQTPDGDSTE